MRVYIVYDMATRKLIAAYDNRDAALHHCWQRGPEDEYGITDMYVLKRAETEGDADG